MEEVTWAEIEELLDRLRPDDLHSVRLETRDGMTSLCIVQVEGERFSVNWHSDSGRDPHSSYILVDDSVASSIEELTSLAEWDQGARYQARQTVARGLLVPAAKVFFETTGRAPGLPWSHEF